MDKLKFNLPEKVFKSIFICVGILMFFVLAGIIPLSRYNAHINKEITKLQSQIKEQKDLNSLYEILSKNTAKTHFQDLPNAPKTTLSRQETSRFEDVFGAIAIKSGLKTVAISPELGMLTSSSNFLLYTAILKGEFANFRKMLLGLGNIPYLEKIEEISIQQHPDSLEFKMRILIALGN